MNKILKFLIFLMAITAIGGCSLLLFKNKSLPKGTTGSQADQLAKEMMASVNHEAWEDIGWMHWTFRGAHTFLWDKKRDLVEVTWKDNKVLLNTKTQRGKAYTNGVLAENPEKMIDKAWSFFCNDSFWLNPVSKAFDPGTERSLVELKDGRKGLKVAYTSGGVTPGDSYVWILDENNRPTAWKMWVKILPIGGIETSWEDWITLPNGAMISKTHNAKQGPTLELSDIRSGNTFQEMGRTEDPFKEL